MVWLKKVCKLLNKRIHTQPFESKKRIIIKYPIMRKVFIIPAVVLALGMSFSCTRQKEAQEAQTKTQLLTSARWDIYKVHQTVWVNDSLAFDETENLNSTATFKDDKTVTIVSLDKGTETFTWGLYDQKLQVGPDVYTIETLTQTELILTENSTESDPDLGSVTTRNRLFFKH